MHALQPALQQIPEEPSSEGSRSSSRAETAPESPRSNGSMDARRVYNFSRPRPFSPPPDQSFERTPTFDTSPKIGSQFEPQNLIHRPYAQSNDRPRQDARYSNGDQYDAESDDSDDAAPPPVVRTYADRRELSQHLTSNNPQTWIYKPYADSVISDRDTDASSIVSQDTITTEDTESIAESTATGQSDASDFTFDGRMGWNPQRPSQAERERQRWAAPVHLRPPLEEQSYNPSTEGRRSNGNRDSWLSEGSSSTATSKGSQANGAREAPAQQPRRKTHRDVFEAAAERQGSLHANPAPAPTSKSKPFTIPDRSSSSATRDGPRSNGAPAKQTRPTQIYSSNGRSRDHAVRSNMPPSRPNNISRTTTDTSLSSLDSNDWKGSNFDVSSLSEEKIRKLEKKGINPALYMEMKKAKGAGGRKLGILTGNSFLS